MNLKNLSPWNWFKHEQKSMAVPVPHFGEFSPANNPLSDLHTEMDRMFNRALRGFASPTLSAPELNDNMADFFRPNLDIKESKKNYQVSVEMPGVDKNDIDITIDGGRLMIRGEKKKENTQEDENYHFVERSYGSFQRILDLPEDAETENLDASFKKGILTLKLNKKKTVESEARKIEIKT